MDIRFAVKRTYTLRFSKPVNIDGVPLYYVGPFDTSSEAARWCNRFEHETGYVLPDATIEIQGR